MLIQLDHKIRIALSELPEDIMDSIQEALSIPNLERQKAMEQDIWGWRVMPEEITLWQWDGASNHLIMPRGFLPNLLNGLRTLHIYFEIDDQRTFDNQATEEFSNPVSLRPWQIPARESILTSEEGIWKAPAGSGKTVGILETIRSLNCPSIVLVNTKDIMYQWRARAHSFLGDDYPVGLIGDGHFEISDYLTVATAQTLNRRFDQLEESGFFDQFSFMCLDECHHATAETYNKIVNRFSARYRIGVSATPDKTGDFALATNVLGPIIHETKREDVDSLILPEVFKISTEFDFNYVGKVGRRPSNYPQLVNALITDVDRNNLIIKSIMMNQNSHSLVISKRLEHLKRIADGLDQIGYPHLVLSLTGQESSEARREVILCASRYPCVVMSTLADEALDIPRLDRLFLIFPQRNTGLIEQQVGRIARAHPDKKDAKLFDFADMNVGPLEAQWRIRRLNVYMQHGYSVTPVSAQDIMNYDLEGESDE